MRMAAVNWLWLVLAFGLFKVNHSIQVAPDSTLPNSTATSEVKPLTLHSPNSTIVGDSELSASERNRRLIPYMAFYLPAPEFPINQQYSIQRPKQNPHTSSQAQHQLSLTAAGSAGPLPPPAGHIPIPTAYVHMKQPAAATGGGTTTTVSELQYPQHYQPSAGEVYHTIAYGGQYPVVPAGLKEVGKNAPILHLLPPGPPGPSAPTAGGGPLATYKEISPHKHKTVQHFPPTAATVRQHAQIQQQQQQQPQPQQHQVYRQRPKQSKLNLTPFTPSNTVPGHFIPIIYTPLSNGHKGNPINYSYDTPTALEAADEQQQQQQYQHNNSHQQLQQQHQQQQQIDAEYPLPPSATAGHHQQQHVKFIAVTGAPTAPGPATAAHPSHIYHVINEASSSQPLSSAPQHRPLIAPKQQQFRQKHPHFHPPIAENFFDSERYLNADNVTPQEKYVMYLQQRIRYNKHHQQQQKQQQRERTKEPEPYVKQLQEHQQQQQQQIFVISTTASPVDAEPIQMQHHQEPQHNYVQHSPIRHTVYSRPEMSIATNHHQAHSKPLQQQVLHIPVRTIVGELDVLHNQQHQDATQQQQQLVQQQQYSKSVSPPTPPQYINYIIDEPKQSLEEEQHPERAQQHPHAKTKPSPAPPQAAYIVISTASPHSLPEAPSQEHYVSTARPLYRNQPTLQLHPVTHEGNSNYPTRRPTVAQPVRPSAPTPKYAYVSRKPSYGQVLTPTPAIKLRPSYKYEPSVKSTIAPPPAEYAPDAAAPRPHEPSHPSGNYHHTDLQADPNQLPDIRSSSLAEILHKLQASNHLPHTLTPDNIDNSIKTLITILNNLKQTQTIVPNPPQHHDTPPADYDYTTGSEEEHGGAQDLSVLTPAGPNKHPGPSTGRPGIDYPNYAQIPKTSFDCGIQRYKGFFGDPETNCQVWHYCDLNGGKASFLCPNGTIFSQIALTCDWWFNVKCSTTAQLYVLNERLYKYILPFTPKFPEDYSGPIVDKYLAMKFQEMEEKMRVEKEKVAAARAPEVEQQQNHIEETTTVDSVKPVQPKHHETINSLVGEQSSERNLLIDDEDDGTQRASVDTFESTTKTTTTTNVEEQLPLSLKPIVVSSTVEPEYEQSSSEEQESSQNPRHTNEQESTGFTQQHTTTKESPAKQGQRDDHGSTKISVEKVEVIEIKSDGTSGHLTPEMLFNNAAKKR